MWGHQGQGSPKTSPEHPVQRVGSVVKGRGLTPIPVAQGWVSLCAAMAAVTEPPLVPTAPAGTGLVSPQWGWSTAKGCGSCPCCPKALPGSRRVAAPQGQPSWEPGVTPAQAAPSPTGCNPPGQAEPNAVNTAHPISSPSQGKHRARSKVHPGPRSIQAGAKGGRAGGTAATQL